MGQKKSRRVMRAVNGVISGRFKTAYQAAKATGVAQSSISRDEKYKAWKAKKGNEKK